MNNKKVLLGLITVISISIIAAITILMHKQNVSVKSQVTNQFSELLEQSREENQKELSDILQKYGYQELYKEIEDNNVNVIKTVVTSISTKDYQGLLKIMKDNGNEEAARTMEAIKPIDPPAVYDIDEEVESCH